MVSRPMTLMSSLPTKPPPGRSFPYRPHTYRAINIPWQCSAEIELVPLLLHVGKFLPVKLDAVSTQVSTTIFPLRLAESTAINMLHLEILHIPFRIKWCWATPCRDEVAHCTDSVAMREVIFYAGRSNSLFWGFAGLLIMSALSSKRWRSNSRRRSHVRMTNIRSFSL